MHMTALHLACLRVAARASAAIALACGIALAPAAHARKAFDSPQAAMEAFGQALSAGDEAALKELLGAQFREWIPPAGAQEHDKFLEAWARSHGVQENGAGVAHVAVGDDGWTLPIPIVRQGSGWAFDTAAGVEEMRIRRIGRNELAAQKTLLAIADAQAEYVSQVRDEDDLPVYARRLRSSAGKRDGLYWPTKPGQAPSPIGPALAAAAAPKANADGYYGYHYKLLTQQGEHAPGGAIDYVVRGKLIGGYAILAWPARYWDTGVMSFMVNHEGQVYERDLGPDTAKKAAAMTSFDPGPGWEKTAPP